MPVKIEKSRAACNLCERHFKGGDHYTSFLYLNEERYERRDLCDSCLEKAEAGAIAQWKVSIEKKKKMVLSESAIWQTLKNKQDPELGERPLTFILCLMMSRKRKLRMVKSQRIKGHEFQNFVNQSRGVNLSVKVPALGPAAFHQLQEDMSNFFSGDT